MGLSRCQRKGWGNGWSLWSSLSPGSRCPSFYVPGCEVRGSRASRGRRACAPWPSRSPGSTGAGGARPTLASSSPTPQPHGDLGFVHRFRVKPGGFVSSRRAPSMCQGLSSAPVTVYEGQAQGRPHPPAGALLPGPRDGVSLQPTVTLGPRSPWPGVVFWGGRVGP